MKTRINTGKNSTRQAIVKTVRLTVFRSRSGLAVVVLVLFLVVGCGILKKSEPKLLPSEIADAAVARPFTHVPLNLNSELLGTTADLRRLREMIAGIMQQRAANGVFKVGSNEIENTIFVEADRKMPVGVLADVLLVVNQNGGKAYLPVNTNGSSRSNEPVRPNPLTLVLSAGEIKQELFPAVYELAGSEAGKYAVSPTVEILTDRREITSARAIGSSVEISASGEYFFNGPTIYLSTMDIEEVEIVQRRIDEPMLPQEVSTVVPRAPSDAIKIIASEFASVASLFKIFEAVEATRYHWKIVVRRASKKPSRKS